MRLLQFTDSNNRNRVGISNDTTTIEALKGDHSLYMLAQKAIRLGKTLAQLLDSLTDREEINYESLIETGRILPPVTHPDPAHMLISGTGLTHLGSASTRNQMHVAEGEKITDSMRMFQWGIEGGKPSTDETGVQPEWFYKGDGDIVVSPFQPILSPSFALDYGEEPEIAGIYLIGPDGNPFRLGFALGNEFSDHVTEKQNYLYLAHSKLRACSFGPELLLGELPGSVEGISRIIRGGKTLWEKPFLSGENNMSHSIANLEHHHFKYPQFRRPGDVHVHFFGTATLSFAEGVRLAPGDEMEISAYAFGRSLRNTVKIELTSEWRMKEL